MDNRELIEYRTCNCRRISNIAKLTDAITNLAQEWDQRQKTLGIPLIIAAINTQYFSPVMTSEILDMLSVSEVKRQLNYKNEITRVNFCIARIILRTFSSQFLGIKTNQVKILMTKNGKPYILGNKFRFNISHSGTTVIIAIDTFREIGIDIEEIKLFREWQNLAIDIFSNADVVDIKSLSRDQQLLEFYRKWTLYESMGKAIGCGLSILNNQKSSRVSLEILRKRNNITKYLIEEIKGYTGFCSIIEKSN